MRSDEHRLQDRDLERAVSRLGDEGPSLSEPELRRLARQAASGTRPGAVAAGRWARRPRLGWSAAAVTVALLVGSGLGFGVGSSVTPSGNAGTPARGLGFLPVPGWTIVQGGSAQLPGPSRAIAANVQLHAADRPDRLPARTIATLPARGMLIHVTFEARGDPSADVSFPPQALPLRVADATRVSAAGATPSRYRLRAGVGGFNVDAGLYYGRAEPTPAMVAAAQRQLSRLTVAAERVTLRAHPTIVTLTQALVTLSGSIDRPVAGEVVDIQAKDCGQTFFRGRAGTTTTGGGEFTTSLYPEFSTTLRAVWDGNASASVAIWRRAGVFLRKRPGGRFRVSASAGLWRKKVLIQRRTGSWKTIKTVLLTESTGFGTYFRLSVPKGSQLRAVLPRSQAKPCFLEGISPVVRT